MSRSVTEYFKTIGTTQNVQKTTKRKLSCVNKPLTPQKSLELSPFFGFLSEEDVSDEVSSSSNSTIIYTPETPTTPRKSDFPQCSYSKNPVSPNKFFSPVKKKKMIIRTPSKAQKNLCHMMDASEKEDNVFIDACTGMDDKTVFLLTIINKYLINNDLQPLLTKQSQELLSKCMKSKKPGMRLVCRLYWRKAGWYRLDEIKKISIEKGHYVDVSIIQHMINNLTENGIIENANCEGSTCVLGIEDYLALLNRNELVSICKDLKKKTNNKKEAIAYLRSYSRQKENITKYLIGQKSNNANRLLELLSAKTGPCYRLSETLNQTLKELHLLMYLGMNYNVIREKKLELTLINDKTKRECYPEVDVTIDDASVVFKTREDFERYVQAHDIYEDFLITTDLQEKCHIVENVYKLYKSIDKITMLSYRAMSPWLQRFTPPYLYVKILEAGLQDLKRMKADKYKTLAVDILTQLISQKTFRQHRKSEWYAEKALILDSYMSDVEEAANVLLQGFNSELSEVAKDGMRPRAMKIAMRQTNAVTRPLQDALLRHASKEQILEQNLKSKHIYKIPMESHQNRGKIKFETRSGTERLVQDAEEFCLDRYIADENYTHGEHWEGKMVTTIFFLLFWDIIYAKLRGVRGVFLTHYQVFPLDLFLDCFYVNRKALIEERLKEIEESPIDNAVERMYMIWNSRPETELSGIVRNIGWDNVCSLTLCLKPRALAAICRRLATDYGYTCSGFPDLTLWNERTKQVKFVEVKTDSDKPSMKQIQWMHYLKENDIETEFCYVGANTMRCKARNIM